MAASSTSIGSPQWTRSWRRHPSRAQSPIARRRGLDEYNCRMHVASRQRVLWTFANAASKRDLIMEISMAGSVSCRDSIEEYQIELETKASRELFVQIFGHDVD